MGRIGLIVAAVAWTAVASAQTTTVADVTPAQIRVSEVRLDGDTVTGVLTNTAPRAVEQVRLLIRYVWLWNDERNPGADSPGRAAYSTVEDRIAPGGRTVFTYRPAVPLPARADGRFTAAVEVVGLTEIGE
jgi:hypothetical protein